MIFRNIILNGLDDGDLTALRPSMREVALSKGDVVVAQDGPVPLVYFPSSVVLSEVVIMEDGRMVEVATVGSEGMAGGLEALSGLPWRSQMFAQIAGAAVTVSSAVLMARAAVSPVLLTLLTRAVSDSMNQSNRAVACNALHGATPRLARWLLMTQDRVGGPEFALTQEYMAIMVGVQRTTISAAAKELKQRKLIRYTRGIVRVLNRAGLEAIACECYEAVRRDGVSGLV